MKIYSKLIIAFLVVSGLIFTGWYVKDHFALVYEQIDRVLIYIKSLVLYRPLQALAIYVSLYVTCAMLAIPVLIPLTLCGGMLFGAFVGGLVAVVSATVGALISFLLIRKFFLPLMSVKYEAFTGQMDQLIGARGVFGALLILHLLTIVPYVVINVIAAIAGVSVPMFVAAALLGSAPVLFVYAFAGAQFGMVQSLGDIFSVKFIVAIVLLVCFVLGPLILYGPKKNKPSL